MKDFAMSSLSGLAAKAKAQALESAKKAAVEAKAKALETAKSELTFEKLNKRVGQLGSLKSEYDKAQLDTIKQGKTDYVDKMKKMVDEKDISGVCEGGSCQAKIPAYKQFCPDCFSEPQKGPISDISAIGQMKQKTSNWRETLAQAAASGDYSSDKVREAYTKAKQVLG